MSERCEICQRELDINEHKYTGTSSKCLIHCDKNKDNGWIIDINSDILTKK